jgi:hypothetical protein
MRTYAAGKVRLWVGLAAGVAAVAAVLALPAPPGRDTPGRDAPGSAAGRGGTPDVAAVWPGARVVDIPAVQPDGRRYTPLLVLDDGTSAGRRTDPGTSASQFVLRTGGGERVLRPAAADTSDVVTATATPTALYWVVAGTAADGTSRYSIWSAGRDGGAPQLITDDAGNVTVYNSEYDFQAVDGRLHWLAARDGAPGPELRSVPVGGGPVTRTPLDGNVTLSAWPWLVTVPGQPGQGAQLTNVVTGELRHAPARGDEQLMCSPAWCLATTVETVNTSTVRLRRPDGSDSHEVGTGALWPAVANIAVLDRFAVLATDGPPSLAGPTVRLSLYDLRERRLVLVDPAAVDVASRNGFLWWSNSAGESLVWHVLDLRTLG